MSEIIPSELAREPGKEVEKFYMFAISSLWRQTKCMKV